jgi:hypothetical protein
MTGSMPVREIVAAPGHPSPPAFTRAELADSRVRSGPPPADVLARCRHPIVHPGPCRFEPGALARLTERLATGEVGRIVVPGRPQCLVRP